MTDLNVKGKIIFIYRDGYKEKKLIGCITRGMFHLSINGMSVLRPYIYYIQLDSKRQNLSPRSIAVFNQWIIEDVLPALERK